MGTWHLARVNLLHSPSPQFSWNVTPWIWNYPLALIMEVPAFWPYIVPSTSSREREDRECALCIFLRGGKHECQSQLPFPARPCKTSPPAFFMLRPEIHWMSWYMTSFLAPLSLLLYVCCLDTFPPQHFWRSTFKAGYNILWGTENMGLVLNV